MSKADNEPRIEPDWLKALQAKLLDWYEDHGRSFAWRETDDPFEVLLAEKLLQQTAARPYVVEIYRELILRYPTPDTLAQANLEELQALLRPLGLFRRSTELIVLANQIVNEYSSEVPEELRELLGLPGVGQYTARAVKCFGFDQDIAIVDTNVARWLHRLFLLPDPLPQNPARKRTLIELAQRLLPEGAAKDYNWAVLDLCAKICVAGTPDCLACPLLELCAYGQQTMETLS